jgi:hypothetical protein
MNAETPDKAFGLSGRFSVIGRYRRSNLLRLNANQNQTCRT